MKGALSKASRFVPLETLGQDSIALFRESFFKAQRPVVLSRGLFSDYRAASRWFSPSSASRARDLNYAYLEKHGDCYVPLELTIPANGEVGDAFERAHRPLSLFLQWTRSVQSLSAADADADPSCPMPQLYLAQCQLLDLPGCLREDFPTPAYVAQAGKGDVYDTNIWIGMAPTYTPLHRDPNPNLFVQLAGSKCVRLLAPDAGRGVFAQVKEELKGTGGGHSSAIRGNEMMKGAERQLLDRAVWGGQSNPGQYGESTVFLEDGKDTNSPVGDAYEAVLHAGDAMFIPTGWWHSIKGFGQGVTASVNWWFR